MTKVSFFSKLQKQKKLQLVQPSEELCKAYLEKSEKSLNSAKATFGIGSYEDAVALAYYSMYYVVLALLFKIGVKCENHTAAIILLEQIFDINNELIQKAKPNVSKNSAGYLLWNVWNKNKFDLAGLFTGAQGTLGLITKIKFRLIKPKKYSRLLIIFFQNV